MSQVANALREYRDQRGWNQDELAKRIGVSQRLLSYWETDERPIGKFIFRFYDIWERGDVELRPLAYKIARLCFPGWIPD